MLLKTDFGETFNKGNWALVPCLTTLKEVGFKALMVRHAAKSWPPYLEWFPDTERFYCFVHFCGSPSSFLRLNDDHHSDPESLIIHHKPFDKLPAIQSHIHPYFVICDVAQKVLDHRQNRTSLDELPSTLQECLDGCVAIYNEWLDLNAPSQGNQVPPNPGPSARQEQTQASVGSRKANESRGRGNQSTSGHSSGGKRARRAPSTDEDLSD